MAAGLVVLGATAVLVLVYDKKFHVRSRFGAWREENEDALTTVSDCITIMVTSMQTLVMVSDICLVLYLCGAPGLNDASP